MLALARERALGAHPYLVMPEHTAAARAALGDEALLAPEQAIVLTQDSVRAREVARAHIQLYLELPFYVDNLTRHGITEAELCDGGSDRLVDTLVAWGDEAAVVARVAEHQDAGADHVALRVLGTPRGDLPLAEWRRLADAFL
jgi:probable F420-dependent oxidoreductase